MKLLSKLFEDRTQISNPSVNLVSKETLQAKKIQEDVRDVPMSNKNYPLDVKKIHEAFYFSSDDLLEFAKNLLSNVEKEDTTKGKRLQALGFASTKEVKIHNQIESQKKRAKDLAETITYYSLQYPNKKFITEDKVEEICKKYNLVFGEASLYTGFVPDKNIQEIEEFQLKKEDVRYSLTETYSSRSIHRIYVKPENLNDYKSMDFRRNIRINKNPLLICAPLKDMNMENKELQGHIIVNKHIPDPVVLKPVEGGYIVVTMWGPEASDPELNSINN